MYELTLEASVENLAQVLAFVDGHLEELECPMRTQLQLDVAIEEIFVNVASYAYAPETGDVTVQFVPEDDSVSITFIDSGVAYDPLAKDDPDVTLSAEERQIGGLGIYMVKKSMDDVHYVYCGGRNIFTIVKKLR